MCQHYTVCYCEANKKETHNEKGTLQRISLIRNDVMTNKKNSQKQENGLLQSKKVKWKK